MKFLLKSSAVAKLDVDVLAVFSSDKQNTDLPFLPKELLSLLEKAKTKEQFEAKDGEFLVVAPHGYLAAYKLLIAGVGTEEIFSYYQIQKCIASTIRKINEFKPAKIALVIPPKWLERLSAPLVTSSIIESVELASYRFMKYKSEGEQNRNRNLEEVILQVMPNKLARCEEGLNIARYSAKAVLFARDLVNEPAAVTTPSYLANLAKSIGNDAKGITKVTVLEKEELIKLGMGAFLGVSAGSSEEPKFIRLHYKPQKSRKKVVIIGKGITFDTGGLSLKSAENMETMKLDMSGAAVILAVFSVLKEANIDLEVTGIIAACENMPSGKAVKPGDILTAMNKKTIEVLNTDAEGRLTLADAISYAVIKEKPDEIIDLATLTGACMVALGQDIAGLWVNDELLASQLQKSAELTGENIWRMPLVKEYKELIKSGVSDIKNIQTGKYGGAITAALFLQEFVGKTKWAHFDIAGPAFAETDTPLTPRGGTGFGVRLLLNFLSSK